MQLPREIRSSFYTVYSQRNISDVSSSRKRSLRLVETAEIQVKRCSPIYFEPMPNLSKTLETLFFSYSLK